MALYTDSDKQRMQIFVNQLINNPNLNAEPLTERETHIINFISTNESQLQPTLKDPRFFPNLAWDDTLKLLLTMLRDTVMEDLTPRIDKTLDGMVWELPVSIVTPNAAGKFPVEKKVIRNFVLKMAGRREVRPYLDAALRLINNNIPGQFCSKALERKEYIYNEIVKVGRLTIESEDLAAYLNILCLLKIVGYLKVPIIKNKPPLNARDLMRWPNEIKTFEKTVGKICESELPHFNEGILLTALHANYDSEYTEIHEATARLLLILHDWGKDFREGRKTDKGAETPAKSWMNVQRRNAKTFGYEPKMIDELFRIAADEGW